MSLVMLVPVSLTNRSFLLVLFLVLLHSSSLVVVLPVVYRQFEYFVVCLCCFVASFCARCGAFPCLLLICWHLCVPPHRGEFTTYVGPVNSGHLICFYQLQPESPFDTPQSKDLCFFYHSCVSINCFRYVYYSLP